MENIVRASIEYGINYTISEYEHVLESSSDRSIFNLHPHVYSYKPDFLDVPKNNSAD